MTSCLLYLGRGGLRRGNRRSRLPERPGTAPAGVSLERRPRPHLEGSLEGLEEEDSSSDEEYPSTAGEDAESSEGELEPEVFAQPAPAAVPASAIRAAVPAPADAEELALRHEAATVDLAHLASARSDVARATDDDDEFEYAFSAGAAREAPSHVKKFEAEPLPANVVSDTRELRQEELLEEGDEEEESEVSEAEAETEAEADEGVGVEALADAGSTGAAVEEVWVNANAGFREQERLRVAAIEKAESRTITNFGEALAELSTADLAAERARTVVWVPPEPTFLARCFPCLGGPAVDPLEERLWHERETLFALAKLPFQDASEGHLPLLRAVYRGLSGAAEGTKPAARTGLHWEEVGFQGPDPTTDLRGCGMLGLLLLLRLTEAAGSADCQAFDFPTPLVALHCTKWALESLRGGQLSATCNGRGSVALVLESFFLAAFAEFRRRWASSSGPGTVAESFGLRMERAGRVLGETGDFVKGRAMEAARGGWVWSGSAGDGNSATVAATPKAKKGGASPQKKKLPSLQLTDLSTL